VRDVPDSSFATASAVNAAFRQVGAVLGTALLIAIVGDPETLVESLAAADRAYLFAAIASLISGAVALGLRGGERQPALAKAQVSPQTAR
jgi:NTE family protein